ncbi:hypothetical protein Xbed_01852 [Xenorhabdus beddingii]|uniref:DUF2946 domain-containing protein n=1 Tax=Xenorhabdus beddingii TaxID=40578 RepID=A0A1Y2SP09_9GAMM|nr:DUF2946 domain-containing protein [Xenorhabdus beddingii]OTA19922.1 hypothetical protein Xbed_01852 [Xenorhabdus beddingii]
MSFLFRLSQNRTSAFIALLAILMLFIAPVVSKTLEHHRDGIKSEMNHCMSMSDMQDNGKNIHHKNSHPQAASHSMNHGADHVHMGLMDDIACGYCQLLINLPLLATGFVPFILLTLIVSRTPPASCFSGPIIRLFYGESQPRAPPLNESA